MFLIIHILHWYFINIYAIKYHNIYIICIYYDILWHYVYIMIFYGIDIDEISMEKKNTFWLFNIAMV